MREEDKLLEAIGAARAAGKDAVIATVVRVVGSAYRREGTKMLVDSAGEQVCMISGGCLEAEIGEIAKEVMANGEPQTHFFDLSEEVLWGLGLGCGGAVEVYLEPIQSTPAFSAWQEAVKAQRGSVLATVMTSSVESIPATARMFISEEKTVGDLNDERLTREVQEVAWQKLTSLAQRSEMRRFNIQGEEVEVFIDVSLPPPELIVFGAGHDAIPLAAQAHSLGFNVSVVDARPAFTTEERFPNVNKLVTSHPSKFPERVKITPRSFVVVMNHHLERDKGSLGFALKSDAPYIGVLGPRSRFEEMVEALAEEGLKSTEAQQNRVHNPVGLDIGAETPAEIAHSVMSEILAVRNGYTGGFLRERSGRIHAFRSKVSV